MTFEQETHLRSQILKIQHEIEWRRESIAKRTVEVEQLEREADSLEDLIFSETGRATVLS